MRVTCLCGVSRLIAPEGLARLVGRKVTLAAPATRVRCSQCGENVAEVVAEARPRRAAAVDPESVRLNTMDPSQNPIASSFVTQTIYDRAHRHLRHVGLLLMMPLLAGRQDFG